MKQVGEMQTRSEYEGVWQNLNLSHLKQVKVLPALVA